MRFLFLFLPACCLAQSTASIDLSNGVSLTIATSYKQAALAPATGKSFYRIFRDQNNLVIYCYELAVDRPEGGDSFRLTLKPSGAGFSRNYPGADGGKPVPTLSAPRDLPTLHSGDSIPVDVFDLAGQGLKAVDTISLHVNAAPPSGGHLRFADLKVYINRTLMPAPSAHTVEGRFAMFYIPGRGGYFLSTAQPPGLPFVQAGWIDRTRMQFTIENETFDATADSPILVGSDRGEIWVYHDPAYKPEGHWTEPLNQPVTTQPPGFFTAAANTLNWWLPGQEPRQ